MKHKSGSLKGDLIKLSVIPLLFLGVAVLVVSSYTINESMEREIESSLHSMAYSLKLTYDLAYPGEYSLENGRLKKGGRILSGDFTVVDRVKAVEDMDATVFYGDKRMLTSIRNGDGSRAVGTVAAQEVTQRVFENGLDYFSKNVSVNGQPYFGYYTPLKNSRGETVGMLFVGKPRRVVLTAIKHSIFTIMIVVILLLVTTSVFSVLYAKKVIFALNKIKEFLKDITCGNLHAKADAYLYERKDEIGEMGKFAVILQKSIIELVGTDPLTGLYNRRSGQITLENSLRIARKNGSVFSIAIGDIDGFKEINDHNGHLCGDAVLKKLAHIFKAYMEVEGFVFRWGGEEFLFVYDGTPARRAGASLNALLGAIRDTAIEYETKTISITMTIGVAQYEEGADIHSMMEQADRRLYFGKVNGKNQVVCDEAAGGNKQLKGCADNEN